ncbi:MAG TPA: glycosyltransferase family 4 protein [Conexibacter sp.]|nr:glycosyltransferase family 4 protein [Conexibacter sp.]
MSAQRNRTKDTLSACTIVSRNYLSHARILAESFARHEPQGRFYLMVVDRLPDGVELPDYIELIDPAALELPHLYEMCFKYDVTELSTAVKPALLNHLMTVRGETRLCYFDPDILIDRPLDELRRRLVRAGIVLVPHLLDEIPLDGRRPSEQDILIAGSYNLGFIGLRRTPETLRLLEWWSERLRDLCRVSPAEGLMTDQKWIDLVPGLFPSTSVLRDDTYDVAYWNLHSRKLELTDDGAYLINGRPLAFFHFSGFKPTDIHTFSKHQDRFVVAEHPALERLLTRYAALHDQHDYATSSTWEYGYSRFSNGIGVHPILRQLYLGLRPEQRSRFGDPFDTTPPRSFLSWATDPRGDHMSRFLETLCRQRYDLAAAFPDVNGSDRDGFLEWAATQGAHEERFAPELVKPARERITVDEPASVPVPAASPPGVNVIGYLRSESGLGAACRGYVRALRTSGTPISLIDAGHLTVNRTADPTIVEVDDEWRHDVNLVVINADEHFHVVSELGEQNFRNRYNIGVWAWELPSFPQEWHNRFPWYDEIWVGTSFIAGALAKVSPIPVVVVPPVMSLDVRGSRKRGRARLKTRQGEFVFAFIFDFHSFAERKNPVAVVEAFTRAFKPDDNARLVIKCVNEQVAEAQLAALEARASGHRVDILCGYWPVQEVRDLMAAADAYVSLHRAEGTGLTLSDAMAHGKPVIATGWSGNTDFMNVANSYPVDYELVTLERDVGPYPAGETWAEPSVEHAAELMRHVFDDPGDVARRGKRARADIEAHFSEASVAQVVGERLAVIPRAGGSRNAEQARTRPPEIKGHPDYQGLVSRLRLAVEANTRADTTLAVVTRGDELLLDLGGRTAWHFPRNGDGGYAGYYPTDSDAAVAHLEQLRANGAEYLVIPASSGWWLEYYGGMREHLETGYQLVYDDPRTGTIYALAPISADAPPARRGDLAARSEALEARIVELDRIAGTLERRLQATLAWGGTLGESLPAEVARLRSALVEQQERTAHLEALIAVPMMSDNTSNGAARWS